MNRSADNKLATYYRGCSRSEAEGTIKPYCIWLSEDDYYAKIYKYKSDDVMIEVKIDENKLKPASFYDMEDILGYEPDMYQLNEEEINQILKEGYNCYYMEYNSYCSSGICLFDSIPIVSRRIMTEDEVSIIEDYP